MRSGRPQAQVFSAANRGMDFEAALALQHAAYLRAGKAAIIKLPTPWVPHWSGGKVSGAHVAETAAADFVGCLHGGRAVAVEAKSTNIDRLSLSRIRHPQRKYLDVVDDLGGVSLLVVYWRKLGEVWAIPWADVRSGRSVRGRSVAWHPSSVYRVKGMDYLAALGLD